MQPKTAKAVNASKTMLVPEPVVAMVEMTLNSIGHVSRSATTTNGANGAKPMEVELMQPKTAKAVNAAKTIEVELMQPKTAKAVNAAKPMKVELMQPKTAKAVNAAKPMEMELMQPKTAKAVNASKTMLVPEPVVAMVELTLNSISSNPHNTAKAVNAAKPMEGELMQPKTAKAVNATGRRSGLAKPYFIFKLKFQWQGKNGGEIVLVFLDE